MESRLVFWVLLLSMGLPLNLFGGKLRKIWEVDLTRGIADAGGRANSQPAVRAISFSPDGRRLAVGVYGYVSSTGAKIRLVVLDVQNPRSKVLTFEASGGLSDSEGLGVQPPAIAWSSDGSRILAGMSLIHVEDGKTCTIPDSFGYGFVGFSQLLLRPIRVEPPRFDTYDTDCRLSTAWELGEGWQLADVSQDRGIVGALRSKTPETIPPEELVIVDPVTRKIIRSWPTSHPGTFRAS